MLAIESVTNRKFDKVLAQEEAWIRRGVQARRTRNEGRVRRLEALRLERAARRDRVGRVDLALSAGERSGRLVAELEDVTKRFGDKRVVEDFSARILRGDKIGLIGPNGSGKTTLLKLILGEIAPDAGTVRLGTKLGRGLLRPAARRARRGGHARGHDLAGLRLRRDRRRAQAHHRLPRATSSSRRSARARR